MTGLMAIAKEKKKYVDTANFNVVTDDELLRLAAHILNNAVDNATLGFRINPVQVAMAGAFVTKLLDRLVTNGTHE